MVKIRALHQKGDLSPVWYFQMRFTVKKLLVKTTLSHDPFWLKPISSQFQTWDGQGWIYLRPLGTVFWSRFIVGYQIIILVVIGDYNDVLFEFRLARRFRISCVASSLSCSLIFLYIWAILWNISHAILGSLCLALLFLMLDTFTNPVLLFLIFLPCTSSVRFTCLITERVYLDDELAVISLVDCRALNY